MFAQLAASDCVDPAGVGPLLVTDCHVDRSMRTTPQGLYSCREKCCEVRDAQFDEPASRASTHSEIMIDCVIIGGGLSGLATAYGLREWNVLLLEREDRVGGRVLSMHTPHATLDLGACFAVCKEVFPDEATAVLPEPRMLERGPLLFCDRGQVVSGETAWEIIEKLALPALTMQALKSFRDGVINARALPEEARRIVDALFKQIHPGSIEHYIPERQRDALAPLYPDHYPCGNGCAIEAYEAVIDPARIMRGAVVTRLDEDADGVSVTFGRGSRAPETVRAKYAVVATPGEVARTLIVPTMPACAALFESLRYCTYTVVGIVVEAPELSRFRYVVSPDCPLNVVIQQGASEPRYRSLLCYYSDPFAENAALLSDNAVVKATVAHLEALLGTSVGRVCESAVRRWRAVSAVMSPAYVCAKGECDGRATARVFIAGDYVSTDPVWGYGTADAVASGKRASALVRVALS